MKGINRSLSGITFGLLAIAFAILWTNTDSGLSRSILLGITGLFTGQAMGNGIAGMRRDKKENSYERNDQ